MEVYIKSFYYSIQLRIIQYKMYNSYVQIEIQQKLEF